MKKILVLIVLSVVFLNACGANAEDGSTQPNTETVDNAGGQASTDSQTVGLEEGEANIIYGDPIVSECNAIREILDEQAPEELYGGIYFSDSAKTVIMLCDDTEENETEILGIINNAMNVIYPDRIQFCECTYSEAYLSELEEKILEEYGDKILSIRRSVQFNLLYVVVEEHDESLEAEITALARSEDLLDFRTENELADH